jgi:asparagine synthase (glutamine-hydrolysing)
MIPYININWKKNNNNKFYLCDESFQEYDGLSLSYEKKCFDLRVKDTENKLILIFGHLILKDKIDIDYFLNQFLKINLDNISVLKECCNKLNGQFLIIILEKRKNELYMINDRFNGIPIYYANFKENLYISYLYFDIFKFLRKKHKLQIDQDQILQFLWFNKCFNSLTYDNFSKFLISSSILKINDQNEEIFNYWKPDFKKKKLNIKEAGKKFIALLKQSANRLSSDNKKYGLFLSGGHDSRLVLSAFNSSIDTFTVSFSENYEVSCARQVAKSLNSNNYFIKLDKDHLENKFKQIIRICGAQYTFIDALFIDLKNDHFKNLDYVFHGHGLDYLFQGMYLPSKYYKIFGSPIFFKKIFFEYDDIEEEFINNISFRNKDFDLKKIIRTNFVTQFENQIKTAISSITKDLDKNKISKLDIWEYLIIHSLGRHYSRANIISKLSNAKERTLLFDNDLYSFYLSLDFKHRLNSDVVRFAISNINNKIGSIPTGNWGFPAHDSPLIKTIKLIVRKILRMITRNKKYKAPEAKDRTWPDRETLIKNNKFIRHEIDLVFNDNEFKKMLNKLDWVKFEQYKNSWLNDNAGGAKLLLSLLSIYKFFKLTK